MYTLVRASRDTGFDNGFFKSHKHYTRNWRDGSVFKSTSCSPRGPGVWFPAPTLWAQQPSYTSSSRGSDTVFRPLWSLHTHGTQTSMQENHQYSKMERFKVQTTTPGNPKLTVWIRFIGNNLELYGIWNNKIMKKNCSSVAYTAQLLLPVPITSLRPRKILSQTERPQMSTCSALGSLGKGLTQIRTQGAEYEQLHNKL